MMKIATLIIIVGTEFSPANRIIFITDKDNKRIQVSVSIVLNLIKKFIVTGKQYRPIQK